MSDSLNPATIADLVKLAQTAFAGQATPVMIAAPDGSAQAPVLVLPQGLQVHSLEQELAKYRDRPKRRTGTATAETLESFIELTKRFADADSAVFARDDPKAPQPIGRAGLSPCRGFKPAALWHPQAQIRLSACARMAGMDGSLRRLDGARQLCRADRRPD